MYEISHSSWKPRWRLCWQRNCEASSASLVVLCCRPSGSFVRPSVDRRSTVGKEKKESLMRLPLPSSVVWKREKKKKVWIVSIRLSRPRQVRGRKSVGNQFQTRSPRTKRPFFSCGSRRRKLNLPCARNSLQQLGTISPFLVPDSLFLQKN